MAGGLYQPTPDPLGLGWNRPFATPQGNPNIPAWTDPTGGLYQQSWDANRWQGPGLPPNLYQPTYPVWGNPSGPPVTDPNLYDKNGIYRGPVYSSIGGNQFGGGGGGGTVMPPAPAPAPTTQPVASSTPSSANLNWGTPPVAPTFSAAPTGPTFGAAPAALAAGAAPAAVSFQSGGGLAGPLGVGSFGAQPATMAAPSPINAAITKAAAPPAPTNLGIGMGAMGGMIPQDLNPWRKGTGTFGYGG